MTDLPMREQFAKLREEAQKCVDNDWAFVGSSELVLAALTRIEELEKAIHTAIRQMRWVQDDPLLFGVDAPVISALLRAVGEGDGQQASKVIWDD